MKVAIIGAGNVGKALATSVTKAGHQVTLTARRQEHADEAARQVGAQSAPDAASAADGADVVILAIPYSAAQDVAAQIREKTAGGVVVDVTNPLKADYSGLATETSAAEELQQHLPDAKVIKAFNTVFATNQSDPSAAGEPIDGYVAGDDPDAKQHVLELVESIGLQPVDVGPLAAARYLEGMAFLNIGLNARNGWGWTSAWKLVR